jgi:hypothetical protein
MAHSTSRPAQWSGLSVALQRHLFAQPLALLGLELLALAALAAVDQVYVYD